MSGAEIRKILKEALTVLPCDLPEDVNTLVDTILQEELQKIESMSSFHLLFVLI